MLKRFLGWSISKKLNTNIYLSVFILFSFFFRKNLLMDIFRTHRLMQKGCTKSWLYHTVKSKCQNILKICILCYKCKIFEIKKRKFGIFRKSFSNANLHNFPGEKRLCIQIVKCIVKVIVYEEKFIHKK